VFQERTPRRYIRLTLRARLVVLLALLSLLALAPAAGAAGRSVPTGFFGMNWDKDIRYHSTPETKRDAWDRMAEIGVESQRATFNWSTAQFYGKDQDFDWRATDSIVKLAATHHIRLLPVVMQAPPWARSRNKDNAPPKSPKPYVKYLKAAIKRYGPHGGYWKNHPNIPKVGLRDWQIWNEPSQPYQWTVSSNKDWAPGYAKLLKASYKGAKQADKSVRVVLAGLPGRSWEALAHLYDVGGIHGYYDVAAIHPYTGSAHGPLTIVRYFRTVMRQNHDSKRTLLVTETTLPASKGKATSKGEFETTDSGMASFVKEVYNDMIKNRTRYRIGRVYWYTWASDYEGWTFDFTGLIRYRRGDVMGEEQEMPAYDAYRKLALRAAGCSKDATGACVGPPP
jgi:hypothetical protein